MKIKFSVLIITAAMLFGTAYAEGAKDPAAEFVKKLGAGVSQQYYNLVDEPTGKDFDTNVTSIYIGNPAGTRLYTNYYDTKMSNDGATRKFSTKVQADNYGMMFGVRSAKLKGQALTIGFAKKEIKTDRIREYVYQGACQPCVNIIDYAEVESHPFHLGYARDLGGSWNVGLDYDFEKIKATPLTSLMVSTKSYTLKADRTGRKFDLGGSVTKIASDRAPDNMNLNFKVAYKPHKNVKVLFTAGMFTDGLPAGGGVFSDVGGQFIIPYLNGETEYERIYSEKFAYFSLGVGISR